MGSSGSSGKGGTTYISQSDFNAREAKAQAKYKQQGKEGVGGIYGTKGGSEASGGEPGESYTFEGKPGEYDWRGLARALKPVGKFATGNWSGAAKDMYDIYDDNVTAAKDRTDIKGLAGRMAANKASAWDTGNKDSGAGSSLASSSEEDNGYGGGV